jgi:hypothetical protein
VRSLLLVVALVAGCATVVHSVRPTAPWPDEPPPYAEAYKRWTRSGVVWKRMSRVIDVHATLASFEYRAAYLAELARRVGMSEGEHARLAVLSRDEATKVWQVTLQFAVGDIDWDDLTRDDRSMWRIALVGDEGREVLPVSIKQDRRPRAELEAWYPDLGHFHAVYLVTFPAQAPDGRPLVGPDAKRIALRIGSSLARVELVWEE